MIAEMIGGPMHGQCRDIYHWERELQFEIGNKIYVYGRALEYRPFRRRYFMWRSVKEVDRHVQSGLHG